MINIPTVLVLGAGASKPFNFPKAADLVEEICAMLSSRDTPEFRLVGGTSLDQTRNITAFRNALDGARPRSVDAWLEQKENQRFEQVGKAAIATYLLKRENTSNLRPKPNWYQTLWHTFTDDATFETLEQNKLLAIVTFNYDRSLEQDLFTRLKSTYFGKSESEYAQKLTSAIPIIHVYGSLAPLPWQDTNQAVNQTPYAFSRSIPYDLEKYMSEQLIPGRFNPEHLWLQAVTLAMNNIQILPEGRDNPAVTNRFNEARRKIESAQALYFLGFGYHPSNLERLAIKSLQKKPFKIMGTCYGLSYQQRREIERADIGLRFQETLQPKTVYDFLHQHVNFNEL
ncbi:MAG: hypothetical protein ABSG99_06960 [Sedimentisphaerales bacterium]